MPAPIIEATWALWPHACAAPGVRVREGVLPDDQGVELAEDRDGRAPRAAAEPRLHAGERQAFAALEPHPAEPSRDELGGAHLTVARLRDAS